MRNFLFILLCFGSAFAMDPKPKFMDPREILTEDERSLLELAQREMSISAWAKESNFANQFFRPMHLAIKNGNLAELMKSNIVTESDEELLSIIDVSLTKRIILDGINFVEAVSTPLLDAIKCFEENPSLERLEIIKFLLSKQRLDVIFSENTSYLHKAIGSYLPEVAELIIRQTIERYGQQSKPYLQIFTKWKRQTPLHYACACHDVRSVRALIEAGVDLEPKDYLSCTPLHLLYQSDHWQGCPIGLDIIDLKQFSLSAEKWLVFKLKMDTIIDLFRQKNVILPFDNLSSDVQQRWNVLINWDQEIRDQKKKN